SRRAVHPALSRGGSRDSAARGDSENSPRGGRARRSGPRQAAWAEERSRLGALPARRFEAWRKCRARVSPASTIRVDHNTYSVPSRLIGEVVDVQIMIETLEVRLGPVLVERLPRQRGRYKHSINYRHVIDW